MEPTTYALPSAIVEAAARTRRSQPVLVSIRGERRYLVDPLSVFFRCGPYRGRDVDPDSAVAPTHGYEYEHERARGGLCERGDSLFEETTIALLQSPF